MHDLMYRFGVALLGGGLIGLAASLVLLTHGRAAGIAGLFGGLFLPGHDARAFRFWFVAGLVASGLVLVVAFPAAFETKGLPTLVDLAIAGILVGYGTKLGGGCTSGHGLCGLARLSPRSFVATLTFMGVGMVTVFVVRHLLGAGR